MLMHLAPSSHFIGKCGPFDDLLAFMLSFPLKSSAVNAECASRKAARANGLLQLT